MKRSEFNLLVENWRKFLKDGVIQESMNEIESDYSEIDRQEDDYDMEQRMEPYEHIEDDDTTMDAEEPVNQTFKTGQAVQVFNLKDYNNRNNDRLFDDSTGEAWENAGIFFTNSGMDVVVDKYVPGEGYTLRDSEDKESLLIGIPEENIRKPISDEEDKQLYYSTPEGQADLDDKYAQMSPSDKEDLYAWARSRAQGMKFKK